jgi:hypothetical protein
MSSSKLHDLIHALTMSEKRYFKVFSKRHVVGESNDYIHLFDALDKQKLYEEKELKKTSFVKNLSAEKNYLYQLILKSLNSYHTGLNTKTKIYQLLQSVEIMYHKGLYEQCEKVIRKAKKMAIENELFTQLLAINELETELLSKRFDYGKAVQNIEVGGEVLKKIENFHSIQKITTNGYETRLQLGKARAASDKAELKKLAQHKKISTPEYALSKRAEMYQLGMKLTYNYFIRDLDKQLEQTRQMIALYEAHPYLIEYSTIGYVSSLFNLINALQEKGEVKKALATIEKLEACKSKYKISQSPNTSARVFFYTANLQLSLYMQESWIEKAKTVAERCMKEDGKHIPHIGKPQLYEYYANLAKFHFAQKEYKIALRLTNNILNDLSFKIREDLLSLVRLLNLLVHFELGNSFTIDYLAQSTVNYLKRAKRLFLLEKYMLKYLLNYDKANTKSAQQKDLKTLLQQVESLTDSEFENRPFTFFDFKGWVEGKLTNM